MLFRSPHLLAAGDVTIGGIVSVDGSVGNNVAGGEGISLEDLLFRMAGLIGVRPIPEADPDLMRPADIPHLVGDGAKLRQATGWAPRFTLDQTLKDVLDAQAD